LQFFSRESSRDFLNVPPEWPRDAPCAGRRRIGRGLALVTPQTILVMTHEAWNSMLDNAISLFRERPGGRLCRFSGSGYFLFNCQALSISTIPSKRPALYLPCERLVRGITFGYAVSQLRDPKTPSARNTPDTHSMSPASCSAHHGGKSPAPIGIGGPPIKHILRL
jgi:hypothetical protein